MFERQQLFSEAFMFMHYFSLTQIRIHKTIISFQIGYCKNNL